MITFFIALACCPAVSMAGDNPFIIKKLPFRTAEIHYSMEGSTRGTAVEYWDGQKHARHSDTRFSGFMGMGASSSKTIEIYTPEKLINVDMSKQTARATGNPVTYMAEEYEKLSSAEKKLVNKNAKNLGMSFMQMFQQSGGSGMEISEGEFKGKKVMITKMMGMTTYTWKDTPIVLKSYGSIMGISNKTVATKIKTNVRIDPKVFEVPAGIKVVYDHEADRHMRMMAKRMIEWLNDPDFEQHMAEGNKPLMRRQDVEDMHGGPGEPGPAGRDKTSPPSRTQPTKHDKTGPDMENIMKSFEKMFGN